MAWNSEILSVTWANYGTALMGYLRYNYEVTACNQGPIKTLISSLNFLVRSFSKLFFLWTQCQNMEMQALLSFCKLYFLTAIEYWPILGSWINFYPQSPWFAEPGQCFLFFSYKAISVLTRISELPTNPLHILSNLFFITLFKSPLCTITSECWDPFNKNLWNMSQWVQDPSLHFQTGSSSYYACVP